MRKAISGYELPASNDDERLVREKHLRFAIEELDRAWTIAESKRLSRDLLFLIRIIQGLCELRIRGGRHAARQYIDSCRISIKGQIDDMQIELKEIDKKINKFNERLSYALKNSNRPPEYRENPRYDPSEPRVFIPAGKYPHIPDGHEPEPKTIMTFNPAPYAQEAKSLKMHLKEVVAKKEVLIQKLEHMETFDQSITKLHEIDLSGSFGLSFKNILFHNKSNVADARSRTGHLRC